jgi:hypothetical protein
MTTPAEAEIKDELAGMQAEADGSSSSKEY